MNDYPTIEWVESELRNNFVVRRRYRVLAAFIVGSEARGTATERSDLDVAVVIPSVRGKSALEVSEIYHASFTDERFKPHWNGRVVDFQFFYPGSLELESYEKIPLNGRR